MGEKQSVRSHMFEWLIACIVAIFIVSWGLTVLEVVPQTIWETNYENLGGIKLNKDK